MRVVTADQMRAMEREANANGMAYDTMMANAGHAVATIVGNSIAQDRPECRVLMLVGPGNNGGDGLVAARELKQAGCTVWVYVWRRALGGALLQAVLDEDVPVSWADEDANLGMLAMWAGDADIIVDALLGTGAKGPLRGRLPEILDRVRRTKSARSQKTNRPIVSPSRPGRSGAGVHVVAVDLPSGMNADTGEIDSRALVADTTITFAQPKWGHVLFPGAAHVGQLLVADIGLVVDCVGAPIMMDAGLVSSWLPTRGSASHKGTHGKAMVVAGSTNYVGAPSLAAEGAYRVGAGLVTLGVPSAIYPLVASRLRESTFLLLSGKMGALAPESMSILDQHLGEYDALLVGPGLGSSAETGEFVARLLQPGSAPRHSLGYRVGKAAPRDVHLPPCVIDADGLNHLSALPNWWTCLPAHCVLTPHPGEMSRLTGLSTRQVQERRCELAAEMANKWQCVVVLKGAYTVIAAPNQDLLISPFATAALAVAGTGDVLAGMIVGLMAQGVEAFRAAAAGVYLHGLVGKMTEDRVGPSGGLASELLSLVPEAMRLVRQDTAHE